MCLEIEVDAEVWRALKGHAEPFVDTPNSVLRRLLDLDQSSAEGVQEPPDRANRGKRQGRQGTRRHRAPAGSLLPEAEYELPILRTLAREGGRAPAREVIAAVGKDLQAKLTELDRETLRNGGFRWENRAQFTRLRLKERGLIESGSPRGVWEISEQGEAFLVETVGETNGK